MTDNANFEKLVKILAELEYDDKETSLADEVDKFEDIINKNGLGSAYFGTAGEDYDRIEALDEYRFPERYKKEGVRFYAEYYDGNQTPFTVCKWKGTFKELLSLMKTTSEKLYAYVLNEEGE